MDAITDALEHCITLLRDAGGWRRVGRIESLARYLEQPNAADLPAAFVFLAGSDPRADNSSTARIRQVLEVRIGVAIITGTARPGPELLQDNDIARQAAIDALGGKRPPTLETQLVLGPGAQRQVSVGAIAYEQQFVSRLTVTFPRTIP